MRRFWGSFGGVLAPFEVFWLLSEDVEAYETSNYFKATKIDGFETVLFR